jgi:hypothetical protein
MQARVCVDKNGPGFWVSCSFRVDAQCEFFISLNKWAFFILMSMLTLDVLSFLVRCSSRTSCEYLFGTSASLFILVWSCQWEFWNRPYVISFEFVSIITLMFRCFSWSGWSLFVRKRAEISRNTQRQELAIR